MDSDLPEGFAEPRHSPEHQSEPPKLATEKACVAAPIEPLIRRLRFRSTRPQPPKPRGIARFSRTLASYLGGVSAHADSMAVGGVGGELVSATNSLICRGSTGNSTEIGPTWRRIDHGSRAGPQGSRRISRDQERGTDSRAQGISLWEQRTPAVLSRLPVALTVPTQFVADLVRSHASSADSRESSYTGNYRFHFGCCPAEIWHTTACIIIDVSSLPRPAWDFIHTRPIDWRFS